MGTPCHFTGSWERRRCQPQKAWCLGFVRGTTESLSTGDSPVCRTLRLPFPVLSHTFPFLFLFLTQRAGSLPLRKPQILSLTPCSSGTSASRTPISWFIKESLFRGLNPDTWFILPEIWIKESGMGPKSLCSQPVSRCCWCCWCRDNIWSGSPLRKW